MKILETIQKTFNVFKILTKVAYVFCIVGAVTSAVGALCAMTQYNGGMVFSLFGEPLKLFSEETDLTQKCAELLTTTFILSANAILLGLTHGYLKAELIDGTPFTEMGANRLKKLGILFIIIPTIAITISGVFTISLGVESIGVVSNFSSVVTGIVLILFSLVFRYGAELEKNKKSGKEDIE